jgi:hypothetical protein
MTETNRGTRKKFEFCFQGGVHLLFEISPSNVEFGLCQKQLAVLTQRFVKVCEEGRDIRDFMRHPERQNEIDSGWKPDSAAFAQMEFHAILHTGMRNASLDLREHGWLHIRRNHTTRRTNHPGEG